MGIPYFFSFAWRDLWFEKYLAAFFEVRNVQFGISGETCENFASLLTFVFSFVILLFELIQIKKNDGNDQQFRNL